MLIDRIFKVKLSELIKGIRERQLFGVPLRYSYVIEFQKKRGLPHVHILITLREQDRLIDNYRINELIPAEILDRQPESVLYEPVKYHMAHGPCGQFNKRAPCMDELKCKKDFPKQYSEETVILVYGTVIHRCRRSNNVVGIKGGYFCSQWVVPYNPFLLKKYRNHINVESYASLRSVKYILIRILFQASRFCVNQNH